MKRAAVVSCVALFGLFVSGGAFAGLFRAYLSTNGKDSNPCTVPQPCRLLPAALAAVTDGGEIWLLDSANYNTSTVNISKSVTIVAVPGAVGSVVATAGNAITINAPGVHVTLRNLVVVPLGISSDGIFFQNGAELDVEECHISGVGSAAIEASASGSVLRIRDTVLRNAGIGLLINGPLTATIDHAHIAGNLGGINALGGAQVNASNSVLSDNTQNAVTSAGGGSAPTQVVVSHSTITGSPTGFLVDAFPGHDASIVSDTNVFSFIDGTVFQFFGGGGTEVIHTRGNNTAGYYNQFITPGQSLTPLNAV
jgi:hypothetical protein